MTLPLPQAVLDAETARCDATLRSHENDLREVLSANLLYVHSNGVVDDRDSYVAKVISGAFRYDSLDHVVGDTRMLSDTVAALTGDMRATGEAGGRPVIVRSRTLSIWQLEADGRWRLAALQSSATPST